MAAVAKISKREREQTRRTNLDSLYNAFGKIREISKPQYALDNLQKNEIPLSTCKTEKNESNISINTFKCGNHKITGWKLLYIITNFKMVLKEHVWLFDNFAQSLKKVNRINTDTKPIW